MGTFFVDVSQGTCVSCSCFLPTWLKLRAELKAADCEGRKLSHSRDLQADATESPHRARLIHGTSVRRWGRGRVKCKLEIKLRLGSEVRCGWRLCGRTATRLESDLSKTSELKSGLKQIHIHLQQTYNKWGFFSQHNEEINVKESVDSEQISMLFSQSISHEHNHTAFWTQPAALDVWVLQWLHFMCLQFLGGRLARWFMW